MKRTKEEAEETKKKLIDIALREFVKHGFENITLENIAAKAGVTRGAIYWHFNNKEDLMDSLIKVKDIESLEILKNIYEAKKPVMEKLADLVVANFPDIKNKREAENYTRLKVDLYNYYLKNGDNRKLGKTFVKYLTLLIIEAKKQKIIRKNVDADEAAHVIYCLLGGLALRHGVNPGKYTSMQSLRNILKNHLKQLEE
jgi:TetR/AcrR family acrAB operon transcriptional repressor